MSLLYTQWSGLRCALIGLCLLLSAPWSVGAAGDAPVPAASPFLAFPARSPYPAPQRKPVRAQRFAPASLAQDQQMIIALALPPAGAPRVQLVTPQQSPWAALTIQAQTLTQAGFWPLAPNPAPAPTAGAPLWLDQWDLLWVEDFEAPTLGCGNLTAGLVSGIQTWVRDAKAAAGFHAGRPRSNSAPNQSSWLVCGPFDLTGATKLLVEHSLRLEGADARAEHLFFGVSSNGRHWRGVDLAGATEGWITQRLLIEGVAGASRVWLAWRAASANIDQASVGVRIDDLRVWRYRQPDQRCGQFDVDDKGLVLTPYDPTADIPAPMIRREDTVVVERLAAAGVHWVRLGFQAHNGALDLQAYDRMVDTLCAQGISVLGMINQETLQRQDWWSGEEKVAADYRSEFAEVAALLAAHFAGRISHWEIWNEPNLAEGAYLPPARYARLLHFTAQAIKRVDPNLRVLFGGLASAWADSHDYLVAVYAELDAQLAGARPFDYLAIHPYPRKQEGPDPARYMHAEAGLGYATLLDKFVQTLAEHGDGGKPIWVTEIGWNSARQSKNRPQCYSAVLVHETEQALYLKEMFDILFNEVAINDAAQARAVAKVFWYQYMDVGAHDPCRAALAGAARASDWWFGLYRGDKVTPKPGWCAFVAYPQECQASR